MGWGGAAFGAGFVAVTPSAAGQINIYPPNTSGGVGSGTGVVTNAQTVPTGVPASTPVNAGLVNTPDNVVVTYNGTTMTIAETQGSNTHTASYALNIGGAVGSTAFLGFTGGTGGATAAQQISNFTFTSPPAVTGTGVALSPIGGAIVQATQIEGGSPMAALVGGGGANGTTTISIIPWAWSNAGGFVTYDPSYGVRPLNTGSGVGSEYLNAFPAAPSFDNVLLVRRPDVGRWQYRNELAHSAERQQHHRGCRGGFNLDRSQRAHWRSLRHLRLLRARAVPST